MDHKGSLGFLDRLRNATALQIAMARRNIGSASTNRPVFFKRFARFVREVVKANSLFPGTICVIAKAFCDNGSAST
jgi:hypothetical protein